MINITNFGPQKLRSTGESCNPYTGRGGFAEYSLPAATAASATASLLQWFKKLERLNRQFAALYGPIDFRVFFLPDFVEASGRWQPNYALKGSKNIMEDLMGVV